MNLLIGTQLLTASVYSAEVAIKHSDCKGGL